MKCIKVKKYGFHMFTLSKMTSCKEHEKLRQVMNEPRHGKLCLCHIRTTKAPLLFAA